MSEKPKVAEVILELCDKLSPSEFLDPVDAAKAYAKVGGILDSTVRWEGYLEPVRESATVLAREGKIVIYCKGVPADPNSFKGIYKLKRASA
jgi:hypothetical protein